MFLISRRPSTVSDVHRIINLNVRGKRGIASLTLTSLYLR